MATERAPHNMTTDTSPSPYVAFANAFLSSGFDPFCAFDGQLGGGHYWIPAATQTGWVAIDFGVGNVFVITDYNVVVNTIPEPTRAPKDWTLEGSNDASSWTVIDTVTNQTGWSSGENRAFVCGSPGTVGWRYVRLNVTANNGDTYLEVAELYLQGEPPSGGTTYFTTLSGDITPAGAFVRKCIKALNGVITPIGTLAKRTNKVLSGSITPAGTYAGIKTALLTLSGAIEPIGALAKRTNKIMSGVITPAGAFIRRCGKILSGIITPIGQLEFPSAFSITLNGTITPIGTLVKKTFMTMIGAITPTGAITLVKNFIPTVTDKLDGWWWWRRRKH